MEKIVVELFAGVGGFRIGFNNVKLIENKVVEKNRFSFVWANQWEPATKSQQAFECYKSRFNSENNQISNCDITKVGVDDIPKHTILVGGFPCQDYSVAHSLATEKGIEGKKGVLWWEVIRIIKFKKPKFLVFENVDRLLKSPSRQLGRDFGIILRSLFENGYAVEWRVINAAEYGHPQKRKRIFIFGFHNSTNYYFEAKKIKAVEFLNSISLFKRAFPIENIATLNEFSLINHNGLKLEDMVMVSENFKAYFENTGLMLGGHVWTTKSNTKPKVIKPLREIICKESVDENFFLTEAQIEKFRYLRNKKKIERTNKKTGFKYIYSEGSMSSYDSINLPGRTMLTSEGNINRSTHIIKDPIKGRLRFLTPTECERLNEFPDGWTSIILPERKRYFMMGNAIVCGVVSKIAKKLDSIISNED